MITLARDSTAVSLPVLAVDRLTGLPRPGLTADEVSATYLPLGSQPVSIPLVALAGIDEPHLPGGFVELDATDLAGWYRLDCPDAAWASGDAFVLVVLQGAAALLTPIRVQLGNAPGAGVSGEVHLCKAALVNRRMHQVSTGIHTIFDDDGITPLVTLTPTDDGDDQVAVSPD